MREARDSRSYPSRVRTIFARLLRWDKALHPVERGMARYWVKRRLAKMFPGLATRPDLLEKAYRELGLVPQESAPDGEPPTYFELLPPHTDLWPEQ